jgi:hypothetical protein
VKISLSTENLAKYKRGQKNAQINEKIYYNLKTSKIQLAQLV